MRVKICGQTRGVDVAASVAAGADALGFIVDVSVDTPRELDRESARELVADVPPFVSAVVVTMAPDPDRLVELAAETGADAVQVHADPGPEALRAVGRRAGVRTVKAVAAGETERARRYDGAADAVLVDSASPEEGGGTGRTHDWTATRELAATLDGPVVLAGGLTPANVGDAVQTVEPYAVDVATGVERADGQKDHDALDAFVANARGGVAA